ncbi:hypothetical protein QVD17_35667 [Tagetes erecta]|uniref:Uncharacterized protein n=1 Tax=Tagetes erecta TaxID=13708 RepID=A0AAD8NHE8_TARER|nr:hypothetical protein QVD17_35667 [Tagetes erecta]
MSISTNDDVTSKPVKKPVYFNPTRYLNLILKLPLHSSPLSLKNFILLSLSHSLSLKIEDQHFTIQVDSIIVLSLTRKSSLSLTVSSFLHRSTVHNQTSSRSSPICNSIKDLMFLHISEFEIAVYGKSFNHYARDAWELFQSTRVEALIGYVCSGAILLIDFASKNPKLTPWYEDAS